MIFKKQMKYVSSLNNQNLFSLDMDQDRGGHTSRPTGSCAPAKFWFSLNNCVRTSSNSMKAPPTNSNFILMSLTNASRRSAPGKGLVEKTYQPDLL